MSTFSSLSSVLPKVGGQKKKTTKKKAAEAPVAEAPVVEATTTPAPKAGKKKATESAPKAKATKMSALDAAAKVLQEAGKSLNCQEMIEQMTLRGYWTSPGGKTPHATLYSAILRELKTKGDQSRFRKAAKGRFEATGVA